ncbi:MAG: phosphoribosylaminoimidazolesuccinocarboxamide synthase, partial [Nanoarchaeota archaeon]
MISTPEIRDELGNTLDKTDIKIGKRYPGKVRDNYLLPDKRIMIATDRISCFDKVVGTVPFKGQVLTQIASYWFDQTKDIIGNHILEIPDPSVMVVKECKPVEVEVIVRGYLTGSLWREYEKGERRLYGLRLPEGMQKNGQFPTPIITPTTKAKDGEHDAPISKEEIIKQKLCTPEQWAAIEDAAYRLFAKGTELLNERNLILVDTKYEFGYLGQKLVLMDEMHTPDSSRFWYANEYHERFREGKEQKAMDKEFVRQWLLDRGFKGDGTPPELTEEVRIEAA